MTDKLTEQSTMIEEEKKENAAARLKTDEHLSKMAEEQTQKMDKMQDNLQKQLEES